MADINKKMELTLTSLTHNQALIAGLSKYNLRLFLSKDSLYVAAPTLGSDGYEDKYIPCYIHTKRKNAIDYVTTDTPAFTMSINLAKQGKEATYSQIDYYDKSASKQSTTTNKDITPNNGIINRFKKLVFKPSKK